MITTILCVEVIDYAVTRIIFKSFVDMRCRVIVRKCMNELKAHRTAKPDYAQQNDGNAEYGPV